MVLYSILFFKAASNKECILNIMYPFKMATIASIVMPVMALTVKNNTKDKRAYIRYALFFVDTKVLINSSKNFIK